MLPLTVSKSKLMVQLMYHNIYRQLKPARKKYNLSGNDILILNGVYLYTLLIKTEFTINSVRDFVKYFNRYRIEYYIKKLIDRGFIKLHRTANTHVFYRLTEEGYKLINELFNEYDRIHTKFINEFNISL